jgi:YNFM family putative membrane transporter
MTYLAEEIHPDSIGLAMGLCIGGSAIGGMGGRLAVGVLADHLGWRAGVAGFNGALWLAGLLIAWRLARGSAAGAVEAPGD